MGCFNCTTSLENITLALSVEMQRRNGFDF